MKDTTDALPIHGVEHLSVLAILFLLDDKQCAISRCQLICLLSTRNNSRVYELYIPNDNGGGIMPRAVAEPEKVYLRKKTAVIGFIPQIHSRTRESKVLGMALLKAGKELGLSQTDLSLIIGKDRRSIARYGINPKTKAGELALLFIKIHQSVFVLMGGHVENMRHLMHTKNHLTGGVPATQLHNIRGIMRVHDCFNALASRI